MTPPRGPSPYGVPPHAAPPARRPGRHCGAIAPCTLRSSSGGGPGAPRIRGHPPWLGALSWRCAAPSSGLWASTLSWRWARTGEQRRRWRISLQWLPATLRRAVGPRTSTTMSYGEWKELIFHPRIRILMGFGEAYGLFRDFQHLGFGLNWFGGKTWLRKIRLIRCLLWLYLTFN
jgi:hypothetical protein